MIERGRYNGMHREERLFIFAAGQLLLSLINLYQYLKENID